MPVALPVLNLTEAKFECTFGRGCEGLCCKEGKPYVFPEEIKILTDHLSKFLPYLRPAARAVVENRGFLMPHRRRLGHPIVRVSAGWCVFFNQGCVLHKLGVEEGDKYRYKPSMCGLFPIQQDRHDRWYVRQKGYKRERWDLFCLDPANTSVTAAETLQDEIALAKRYDDEQKAADLEAGRPSASQPQ